MILVLGFLTGLALVTPVGPVTLTLVGIGAAQGRRAAVAGAGGVVLGDLMIMPIALGGAGFVGGLDESVVRGLEFAMGLALVGLALATIVHAARADAALASIRRPTRTLAAMTLCNPLSVVAWLGLALALPQSVRAPMALVVFGVGITLASAAWHTGVAAASGSFAGRLGPGQRQWLARGSGVFLLAVGLVLIG